MNPQALFCPNRECPASGQPDRGQIRVHDAKQQRYRCTVCRRTFRGTQGTPYHGLRTPAATVTCVLLLLAHGCPMQAIVVAFALDERTVRLWLQRAGTHCQALQAQLLAQQPLALVHIQADELKVRTQGGHLWLACVLAVRSRFFLGGCISPQRNQALLVQLLAPLRTLAVCEPLLVCVDGLRAYVKVIQRTFRTLQPHTGRRGRRAWAAWRGLVIAQLVKTRRLQGLELSQRLVQGSQTQLAELLERSQGGTQINTAYIERFNATLRQRLAPLARRTRALVRQGETLAAGLWLVGVCYNFCTQHASLPNQTPAMASGLTDHCWSMGELLSMRIAPPRWTPPKRRGRRSKALKQTIHEWGLHSTS